MARHHLTPRPFALAACAALVSTLGACGCAGSKHHTAAPPPPSPTVSASATPTTKPATCPLTGLQPQSGQDVGRVALAVKIDNIDLARPQAGLDKADVVVEELVEGGLTRLFAVFQCSSAAVIGPIRSARTSDADLLALLHGSVFAFSGANPRALPPIREHGNTVMLSNDETPQWFHRDYSRAAPHNVFSSTDRLLSAGLARRHGLKAPAPLFPFALEGDEASPSATATSTATGAVSGSSTDSSSPSSTASATASPTAAATPSAGPGTPASRVAMSWPEASASWSWDGHAWQRTQNGTPDVLIDHTRVTASNVVVLQIRLASSGIRDVAGNASPVDVTTGGGTAWIFRDGTVLRGKWRRAGIRAPLRLLDMSGRVVPLTPGRTWIELLPQPRTPRIR